VPVAGTVELVLYNICGQKVRTLYRGIQQAGIHRVAWDGRDGSGSAVGSGVYFVALSAGGTARRLRLVVVR